VDRLRRWRERKEHEPDQVEYMILIEDVPVDGTWRAQPEKRYQEVY